MFLPQMKENNVLDAHFERLFHLLLQSLERREGGPFAAGVLEGGDLIAAGTNSVLSTFDVSRHAEINALAEAGRMRKTHDLSGTVLLSTHYPCLMCYNAVKWARIRKAYYVFSYEDTERLFGFHGDMTLLGEIGLKQKNLERDNSLILTPYSSSVVDTLFRNTLVNRWREEFSDACAGYDLPTPGDQRRRHPEAP